MDGNICRCGTYIRIRKAIHEAARVARVRGRSPMTRAPGAPSRPPARRGARFLKGSRRQRRRPRARRPRPVARRERRLRRAALAAGIFDPNVFLRIDADNTVTVLSKHFEMGQGITTGLATLVAEELEADWSQMRVAFAPNNPELYNNLAFGPYMVTGGSTSLANSWEQMRKVGAAARTMLVQAAASRWGVPAEEIAVAKGIVSHRASKRSATFGELAADAMQASCARGRRAQGPKGLEADRQAPAATRCRRQDDGHGQICAWMCGGRAS